MLLSSSGGRLVAQLNFDLLHVKFDKMYDFELNEMQWRQLILSAAAVSYFYIQVKMLTPQSNILHCSVGIVDIVAEDSVDETNLYYSNKA